MAKRKAAPAATKRAKTRRTGVATRRAQAARTKAAPTRRSKARGTTVRKPARPAKKAAAKARKAARPAPKKAAARKVVTRRAVTRKGTVRKAAARKAAVRKAAVRTPAPRPEAKALIAHKKPALDRARRTVADDDSIPSSLDLDRTASSVRSGRHELARHHMEAPQEDRDVTAGDVDADAGSAYSVGDEAPGGDNPTPDQDVVDEIGHALGMEYDDAEELGGEGKIAGRDTDRWELDPESSEDFDERD